MKEGVGQVYHLGVDMEMLQIGTTDSQILGIHDQKSSVFQAPYFTSKGLRVANKYNAKQIPEYSINDT